MAKAKRKSGSPASTGYYPGEPDDKWRVSSALDTLERAEEYRRDPGLMRKVKAMATDKREKLARIERLSKVKL